jgi:hypothetical protein
MSAEEGTPHPLDAYYRAKGEEWDGFMKRITDGMLRTLEGQPPSGAFDPEVLHGTLLTYWERTGQADKIFSTYTRAQVRAAAADVWAGWFSFMANEWATSEATYPARQKDAERLDRLDKSIAGHNKQKQARADKDYAHYCAVADKILREDPDLVAEWCADGSAHLNISLTQLAEKVRERLGDDPPSVKTIMRAITD